MNMKTGIGITTVCAMLVGVPVFGRVNASELNESGLETAVVATTEQVTKAEDLKGITEAEATEALGESSTAVTKSEENGDVAEILPAEGEVAVEETEDAEYAYTETAEGTVTDAKTAVEVEIIPANGVNGSYVSRFQDTIPVVEEWTEELGQELYDTDAVRYEDETLSKLAKEYLDQGYYISDLKREGELLGVGVGYGEYYFNTGFCVVDNMEGNNTFITYVAKIAQSDFDKFVDEIKDGWTKKSETEYSSNDGLNDESVSFDPATGIFIYTNKLPADAVG